MFAWSHPGAVPVSIEAPREDQDLRSFRLEHGAGMSGGYQHGVFDLGGGVQGPGGLVESLKTPVLLLLGDVGAIGQVEDDGWYGGCPRGWGSSPHHGDGHQPQAGVHQRRHNAQLQHVELLRTVEVASRQMDGEVDEDIGDHDHQYQSHQDADPAGRSLRIPTAEDRPEHDHGEG